MADNGRHITQTLKPSGFRIGAGKFWAGITTRNNRLFYYIVFLLISYIFLYLTVGDFPQYSWLLPSFIFGHGIFFCAILVLKKELFDSEEHIEYMQELAIRQGTRDLGMVDANVIDQELFSASASPSKSISAKLKDKITISSIKTKV